MTVSENDNRNFIIYTRTNRRVQWSYSVYMGRWSSPEEAIENAKKIGRGPFEYRIEEMGTNKVISGHIECGEGKTE